MPASRLVEYCNHPGGTQLSDLRIAHGAREPHAIKTWCLGNKMDGPWQIGSKTAEEYGRTACETAKVMKWVDPGIELVACGSSGRGMPTFGSWEATVLEHTYQHVDYISLHTYYGNPANDTPNFLAKSLDLDKFIRSVAATCDHIHAKKRGAKDIQLSFDEWNVWYHSNDAGRQIPPWSEAPAQLEDVYNLEDALLVGCMLITLLRHADRVKIACLAADHLLPVRARLPFRAWRGAGCAHPIPGLYGQRIRQRPNSRSGGRQQPGKRSADRLCRQLQPGRTAPIAGDARAFAGYRVTEHVTLAHPDLKAANTFDRPDNVLPHKDGDAALAEGQLSATLAPASWNVIRLVRA